MQRKRQINGIYVRYGKESCKNNKTDICKYFEWPQTNFSLCSHLSMAILFCSQSHLSLFSLTLAYNSSASRIIFILIVYIKYSCSFMILSSST